MALFWDIPAHPRAYMESREAGESSSLPFHMPTWKSHKAGRAPPCPSMESPRQRAAVKNPCAEQSRCAIYMFNQILDGH